MLILLGIKANTMYIEKTEISRKCQQMNTGSFTLLISF
jgi:hypothetical protein